MILPGSNWQDGHTYIVVLRDLKSASGKLIGAPSWFEKLRDGKRLPALERAQAKRYAKIFKVLKKAKVAQDKTLYAAWDFTVASSKELTERLLGIRNGAFNELGDTNLGDGVVSGSAPGFTVTSDTAKTFANGQTGNVVIGTFQVPCYLQVCGDAATTGFNYSSSGLYATPGAGPRQRRHRRLRVRDPVDGDADRTRPASSTTGTACWAAWTRSPTLRSTALATT